MDPKKEGLARALTEIDDRFLEEENRPARPIRFPAPALRMAAACLLLALLCVPVYRHFAAGALKVSVNGQNVLTGSARYSAPAVAAFSVRSAARFSVPLELDVGKSKVTLTAGEGSALMDAEGAEAKALSVTGDRNVVWLMDISAGTVFQLTAESGGSIYRITAEYDTDAGSVTVTANKE